MKNLTSLLLPVAAHAEEPQKESQKLSTQLADVPKVSSVYSPFFAGPKNRQTSLHVELPRQMGQVGISSEASRLEKQNIAVDENVQKM